MPTINFTIPGEAKPQGSKNPFKLPNGRIVLVEASKNLKKVRAEMTQTLQQNAYEEKWVRAEKETPITVVIVFTFVKPKTAKRQHHTIKPDIDKLLRFCFDAITQAGNIWVDDSQVVALSAMKLYGPVSETRISVGYDD